MHQLWAPWRVHNVVLPDRPPPVTGPGCYLCAAATTPPGRETLTVRRTPHSTVVLNRFPYTNGHLLVSPAAHRATLDDLTRDELVDLQLLIQEFTDMLRRLLNADGFNVGMNLGTHAGAGTPGHLHWHVVPRWAGDTNFMPVLADAKVIVQSLDAVYDLITSLPA